MVAGDSRTHVPGFISLFIPVFSNILCSEHRVTRIHPLSRTPAPRAARFSCSANPNSNDDDNLTVADALRRWTQAKEAGAIPHDLSTEKMYSVLFVGNDNSTVSVAAEAIFADLVRRRLPMRVDIRTRSAGISSASEGSMPDPMFIEALQFKRKLDVSLHTGRKLLTSDIGSHDIVVCNGL